MLEKTDTAIAVRPHRRPLIVRRIDAIPIALPLKAPMKMAGITITKAENLLVRIESTDGDVGWGEAPSAPTMTGDTLGGLDGGGARSFGADADRQGSLAQQRPSTDADACAGRQHGRAFGSRDGVAGHGLPRIRLRADRPCPLPASAPRRRADVAARQRDARAGHRRGAGEARGGLQFLQAQDRREADRGRDQGRARDPRGAAGRNALRRRQLRADAGGCAALRRAHARRQARVHRAAAARRGHRGPEGARPRQQDADRDGRKYPRVRRYRGGEARGREGHLAQADQARWFPRGVRGGQVVQETRPEDQRGGQDRGIEHRDRGGGSSRVRRAECCTGA